MQRFLRIGLLIAALACFAVSSVRLVGSRHRILLPLDRPSVLVPPFQVDILSAQGTKGLRIPAGVGRGWCNEAGGSARFVFYVPAEGTYTPWACCYWTGACTNAVYMQIDDREKIIFGNDPIYGTWHWVRGPTWSLTRGTHTLTLSNHSDDIALQQIILLSDPQEHPSGQLLASYDIFYDGFDGCDGGNTTAWTLDAGAWRITEPSQGTYDQRWLEADTRGSGRQEPALAIVGEPGWSQYSVRASVRSSGDGWAGICLGWNGPDQHLAVRWRSPANQLPSRTEFEVIAVRDGQAQVLATAESAARPDSWTDVVLDVKPGKLLVSMAGVEVAAVALDKPVAGKVGFMVHNAILSIDDVHVYCTGVKPQETVSPTAATIRGPRCAAGSD